jgi:hypothetical protein
LARRGIELTALLAAVSVANSSNQAAVPFELASATVRSGLLVAAGGTAAGMIPPHVATLAAGVTRAMFLTKVKIATTLVLTVSLLAGGTSILARQVYGGRPRQAHQQQTRTALQPSRGLSRPRRRQAENWRILLPSPVESSTRKGSHSPAPCFI